MRLVFIGTSQFAVPSLKKLVESVHEVVAVVSQPDKPKGRGKKVLPTPVKEFAQSHNIKVLQFPRIKEKDAITQVCNLNPELIAVVSYGQIIPKELLDYPAWGCINVHASLLPEYRGPAPIQRAIMDGKKVTGITTMFMDEGLDTGDIIMQKNITIDDDINYGELENILAETGANLLLETIKSLNNGSVARIKQDDNLATYAAMIRSEEERIDWNQPAVSIYNCIRALSPMPGAYASINGVKLKLFKSRLLNTAESGVAGQILAVGKKSFTVQTGEGTLEILEVQKQGKKRMPADEFLRGFKLEPGMLFES